MTDARLRSEWLNAMRFDSLSDTTWRVFSCALMWSAENGTNGHVPDRYLKMLHPDGEKPDACQQMLEAGLWARIENGYQLSDWDGALGQSTADQVETYKANARSRQRKFREQQRQKLAKTVTFAEQSDAPVTRDETRDVTVQMTRDVGKGEGEGRGKGAKYLEGSASEEAHVNPATGEVLDAPTAERAVVREGNRVRLVRNAS